MWVAQLDRLPTRQRLASWGLNIPTDCCLCASSIETRDHLLITCTFSAELWRSSLARIDPNRRLFLTWAELLSWIRRSSTAAPSTLRKIVAQSVIYHAWRQRNNVLHNQIFVPHSIIFKAIDREIRNIITARRHMKCFATMMQLWIR